MEIPDLLTKEIIYSIVGNTLKITTYLYPEKFEERIKRNRRKTLVHLKLFHKIYFPKFVRYKKIEHIDKIIKKLRFLRELSEMAKKGQQRNKK